MKRGNSLNTFQKIEVLDLQLEYPVTVHEPLKLTEQEYSDDLQLIKQPPPGVSLKLGGTPKIETPSKLPYVLDETMQKYNSNYAGIRAG